MDKKNTKLNFYCMLMAILAINNYSCHLNDLDEVDYESGTYVYYGLFKSKLGSIEKRTNPTWDQARIDLESKKDENDFLNWARKETSITTIATNQKKVFLEVYE